jgi:hypothetical protein
VGGANLNCRQLLAELTVIRDHILETQPKFFTTRCAPHWYKGCLFRQCARDGLIRRRWDLSHPMGTVHTKLACKQGQNLMAERHSHNS